MTSKSYYTILYNTILCHHFIMLLCIGVWGGGGGGAGGAAARPNSGKQWMKFGQKVGEIRAKEEEKIGQRKLQINPFGMWMMTSHRQCPRGCVCLWMSKSRGVFQILGGWMTSRGQCPRGGCACGYLCKISGKSTPLPPLTKAFPYAYAFVTLCHRDSFNCNPFICVANFSDSGSYTSKSHFMTWILVYECKKKKKKKKIFCQRFDNPINVYIGFTI